MDRRNVDRAKEWSIAKSRYQNDEEYEAWRTWLGPMGVVMDKNRPSMAPQGNIKGVLRFGA